MSDATTTVWYCLVDQSHKIVASTTSFEINTVCTIDQLKKRVIEEPDYHDVEPASLNVYKSSLVATDNLDDEFQEKVSALLNESTPLGVAKKIRDCNIGEERMLFVELPWVDVWYRLVNQENNFEGDVSKVSAASILDLRQCVKEQRSNDLRHVDAANLVVWSYKPPFRTTTKPESIKNINFNDDANATALEGDTEIRQLGLGNKDMLIVQFPGSDYTTRNTGSRLALQLKMLTLEDYHQERLAAYSGKTKWPSPSKGALVTAFLKEQNKNPIFNGRPANKSAAPVGLYHDAFNTFQNRLNDPVAPDDPIHTKVAELLEKWADIYSLERDRLVTITPLMSELIGLPIDTTEREKVASDGTIKIACRHVSAFLAIVEIKNEIGSGSSDPYHQAGLAYRQYWTDERSKDILRYSHFPSFLIAIAGPCIMIAGAIFRDKFVIEPLTDYIWLGGAPRGRSQALKTVRLFRALNDGIAELESYYRSLQTTEPLSPFPFITSFIGGEGQKMGWVYRSQPYPGKLVYEAMLTDGKEVIIKFASTYNEEVHRLLAKEGYAPQLHHVSKKLYGGLHMIVMEKVLGRMLEDGERLSAPQYFELKEALRLLHEGHFVHGDVRPPNIIIVEADHGMGGEMKKNRQAMLVDFDDCGKAGVGMYAAELNKELGWPEGVIPGASMRFEHDEAMLKKLEPLDVTSLGS